MFTFEERITVRRLVSDARKARLDADDTRCPWCNETFEPCKYRKQIYCSARCRESERHWRSKIGRAA